MDGLRGLRGEGQRDEHEIIKAHCNLELVHFTGRLFRSYFHNRTGYSDLPHCCTESKLIEHVAISSTSASFSEQLLLNNYVKLCDSEWKDNRRRDSSDCFLPHMQKATVQKAGGSGDKINIEGGCRHLKCQH